MEQRASGRQRALTLRLLLSLTQHFAASSALQLLI
jgi:hypothetical protein